MMLNRTAKAARYYRQSVSVECNTSRLQNKTWLASRTCVQQTGIVFFSRTGPEYNVKFLQHGLDVVTMDIQQCKSAAQLEIVSARLYFYQLHLAATTTLPLFTGDSLPNFGARNVCACFQNVRLGAALLLASGWLTPRAKCFLHSTGRSQCRAEDPDQQF